MEGLLKHSCNPLRGSARKQRGCKALPHLENVVHSHHHLSTRRLSPLLRRLPLGSRHIVLSNDYSASASDEGVLRMAPKAELTAAQIRKVFGYARDLNNKCYIGSVIGAGSFGIVRECADKASGRRFAVKTVSKTPKKGLPNPRYLLKLRTEVDVMEQLGSSLNAVNLRDVFEDDEAIHLVMELCEGGALLERVESGQYSEHYIARLVRSILRFISQCHAKGIIYRDVKPDNFLFLTRDSASPLKATDFGLSIRHTAGQSKLASRSGTPAYMAPELIMQNYDEKADIWSVGMLAYQLLTGRFPFWEDVRTVQLPEVWRAILYNDLDWKAPELAVLSPSAVQFLQMLLTRDPDARPGAAEALEHVWVREEGSAPGLPLQGSVVQRLQRFATYSHLKQVVLKMIMDDMQLAGRGPPLAAALRDLFRALDTDSSGTISYEELASGLRRQGYYVTVNELETLMRKVDLNHDGGIVFDEFLTTLVDWNQVSQDSAVWEVHLSKVFARMDHDGDGFITLEELMDELPPSVFGDTESERAVEAKRMLREVDTNGDGKISREEFYALLQPSLTEPDSLSIYDDRLTPELTAAKAA